MASTISFSGYDQKSGTNLRMKVGIKAETFHRYDYKSHHLNTTFQIVSMNSSLNPMNEFIRYLYLIVDL